MIPAAEQAGRDSFVLLKLYGKPGSSECIH
jgi:hypothetical protein